MEFDYYDISPTISDKTGVYPGDVSFQRKVALSFAKSDHLELSSMTSSLHIGAHADAPSHYAADCESIEQRSLHFYYGEAQVIHVELEPGKRILPVHLKDKIITSSRILFFTGSFPDPEQWNSNFCSLSPEIIDYLAQKKVITLGIDTPSVDPEDSKELESHNQILKYNMAILEGLVLKDVPEGKYHLVALPLKLKGCEASPVRAILIKS